MIQTNLFGDQIINTVPDLEKWKDYIRPDVVELVNKLLKKTLKLREKYIIYPQHHNVLRVFKDLNPKDIKVVILAQDPYYNGNATGYAFACQKYISPSLKQIWNSIKNNTDKTLIDDIPNPNLEYLAKQGVMLLNTVLTVKKDEAFSHAGMGWETFTRNVIQNLSNKNKNVVYLLWGLYAKDYKKLINPVHNLVLTDSHPVYAHYQGLKWDCDHFSKANEYLKSKNKLIINWR